MRDSLDIIGQRHQTDKASQFTRTYAKPHDYLRHMEPFFAPLRDKPIFLLEIGAAGGESIKTWLEYFSVAQIFGVDIVKDTNPYNTEGSGVDVRYEFTNGDQGSVSFWKGFSQRLEGGLDIVIDDGSHYARDIIISFECLWPDVEKGGMYIIEDLNTAYGGEPFTTPGQPTQMDFIKDLLDAINHQDCQIERLLFSRELAIIVKSPHV